MAGGSARQVDPLPAAEGPDLEGLLGYNLKRAYVTVRDDFRRVLGEGGLSPGAFSALSLTVESPGVTSSELARRLGIERSGLVAIVDDLQRRGYLTREGVPGDRRVQALQPTPEGTEAQAATLAAVRASEAALTAGFTDEERETLLGLLVRLRGRED